MTNKPSTRDKGKGNWPVPCLNSNSTCGTIGGLRSRHNTTFGCRIRNTRFAELHRSDKTTVSSSWSVGTGSRHNFRLRAASLVQYAGIVGYQGAFIAFQTLLILIRNAQYGYIVLIHLGSICMAVHYQYSVKSIRIPPYPVHSSPPVVDLFVGISFIDIP